MHWTALATFCRYLSWVELNDDVLRSYLILFRCKSFQGLSLGRERRRALGLSGPIHHEQWWCMKKIAVHFYLKIGHSRSLFPLFSSFQTNITILQQINVKKCSHSTQ